MGGREPEILKLFNSLVKKGMTIVDVGANIGEYTLLSAKLAGDTGKVVSIDADPEAIALLSKNVKYNGYDNVEIVEAAITDKNGVALLGKSVSSGWSSIIKRGINNIEVECYRLDTILNRLKIDKVDIIKIDVEGAELQVLSGAKETLDRNSNVKIMCELHINSEKVYRLLKEKGFSLYKLDYNHILCFRQDAKVLGRNDFTRYDS